MKKVLQLSFCLLVHLYATGQGLAQRMAILPSVLQYGADLSSVCIDYFRDVPTTRDNFQYIKSVNEADKGKVSAFSGARGTGETINLSSSGGGGRIGNDKPFVVSAAAGDDGVSRQYMSFIEQKMEAYKGLTFGEKEHIKLQEEIWEYDILNKIGLMDETGDAVTAFESAQRKFKDKFYPNKINLYFDDYGILAEYLKEADHANQKDGYRIFVINKNGNNYQVFDGIRPAIFEGVSEDALINLLNSKVANNDNVYFQFMNFENEAKKSAFAGTTKTKFAIKMGKNVSVQKFPKDVLLFTESIKHKLTKIVSTDDIISTTFNNERAYKATLDFESHLTTSDLGPIYSKVDAYSNYRDLLTAFLGRVNQTFQTYKQSISLAFQLNRMRKEVKSTMNIAADAELWLKFKSELGESIFVKINSQGKMSTWVINDKTWGKSK